MFDRRWQIKLERQLDAELRRQRRSLMQACEPLPSAREHSDQHQGQQHAPQAARLRLAAIATEHHDPARHFASDALVALKDNVAVTGRQEGIELSRNDSATEEAMVGAARIIFFITSLINSIYLHCAIYPELKFCSEACLYNTMLNHISNIMAVER